MTGRAESTRVPRRMDGDRATYQLACGAVLRYLREERGETQVVFASALGVPQPTLSRWESGRTLPGIYTWRRLAERVGETCVSLSKLVDDALQAAHSRTDALSRWILKTRRADRTPSDEAVLVAVLEAAVAEVFRARRRVERRCEEAQPRDPDGKALEREGVCI